MATINGTSSADLLIPPSLGENDTITGVGGNDTIYGNGGNDSLQGGEGLDVIDAGSGNDKISGGNGNDNAVGSSGNDTVNGDNGNDTLYGGSGNDSVNGGNGNDLILSSDVFIPGEEDPEGVEFVLPPDKYGDGGDDNYVGGAGNDTLSTLGGKDTLSGGNENDVIEVWTSEYDSLTNYSRLLGGAGTDSFYAQRSDGYVDGGYDSGAYANNLFTVGPGIGNWTVKNVSLSISEESLEEPTSGIITLSGSTIPIDIEDSLTYSVNGNSLTVGGITINGNFVIS